MHERRRLNSREKGCRGEREFIAFAKKLMGLEREAGDKRNYQFICGGGASNQDVEIKQLPRLFFEVKNCNEFEIPAWIKQLKSDCPIGKIPCLAIKIPQHVRMCRSAKWWAFFPREHLSAFSREWLAALKLDNFADVDPFPISFDAETFHFAGYIRKKHASGQYIERDGWIGCDMHDLPGLAVYWGGMK